MNKSNKEGIATGTDVEEMSLLLVLLLQSLKDHMHHANDREMNGMKDEKKKSRNREAPVQDPMMSDLLELILAGAAMAGIDVSTTDMTVVGTKTKGGIRLRAEKKIGTKLGDRGAPTGSGTEGGVEALLVEVAKIDRAIDVD